MMMKNYVDMVIESKNRKLKKTNGDRKTREEAELNDAEKKATLENDNDNNNDDEELHWHGNYIKEWDIEENEWQ